MCYRFLSQTEGRAELGNHKFEWFILKNDMIQLYNIPHLKREETFHILKVEKGYVSLTAKIPELNYIQ